MATPNSAMKPMLAAILNGNPRKVSAKFSSRCYREIDEYQGGRPE
jgi:hypothetical protein